MSYEIKAIKAYSAGGLAVSSPFLSALGEWVPIVAGVFGILWIVIQIVERATGKTLNQLLRRK